MKRKFDNRNRRGGAKSFSRKFEITKNGRGRRQNSNSKFRDRPTLRKLAVCDEPLKDAQSRRITERVLQFTQTVTVDLTIFQEVSY